MQTIKDEDIVVLLNPNSGNRKAANLVEKINSNYPGISTIITESLDELDDFFLTKIDNYKAFIMVGGDGTINKAVKYLYGKPGIILGVFPAGSGNGFAREMGFKMSIYSLIADTKKGISVEVDVLEINGKKCINMAGLGFDSFVAHHFQQQKGRGLWNYIRSAIKSIFIFNPFPATIRINNLTIQGKFMMITIANTRQFGNNAIIAPPANPTDRIFNVVLVKPFPFYLYPAFVFRMFSGTLKNNRYIEYYKVKNYCAINSKFKKFHIDGEPKMFTEHLKVKLLKQKISIVKTRKCRY